MINAVNLARAFGAGTIAIAEQDGTLKDFSEITIAVPGNDTEEIQENHMAEYHTLCAMLEIEFFDI